VNVISLYGKGWKGWGRSWQHIWGGGEGGVIKLYGHIGVKVSDPLVREAGMGGKWAAVNREKSRT